MSIANELITRGWTQRRRVSDDGSVCIMGAACAAYLGDPHGLFSDLPDALFIVLGELCGEPISFNEVAGRTFDEVLRVAKLADELLDAS